jgi:shikimate kinase
MSKQDSIILVGPMGSGKSAVGRRLARALKKEFLDTDDEIEKRTGVDIPYIFDKEGEEGFRRREASLVEELVSRPNMVIATGGGTVQNEASRRLLGEHGTVVYLYTSVAEQLRRTGKSLNRPLLNAGDPEATLESLLSVRDPQYREIADLVVETDGRQVAAVTREIKNALTDGTNGSGQKS